MVKAILPQERAGVFSLVLWYNAALRRGKSAILIFDLVVV